MLSKEAVLEWRRIYEAECGTTLSYSKAEKLANQMFEGLKIIHKKSIKLRKYKNEQKPEKNGFMPKI